MINTRYWRTTAYLGIVSTLFNTLAFIVGALNTESTSAAQGYDEAIFPIIMFQVDIFVLPAPFFGTFFLTALVLVVTQPEQLGRYLLLIMIAAMLAVHIISFSLVMVSILQTGREGLNTAGFELMEDVFFLQGNVLFSFVLVGLMRSQTWLFPRWHTWLTYLIAALNFILAFAFYSPDRSSLGYAILTAMSPAWITITSALLLIREQAVYNTTQVASL